MTIPCTECGRAFTTAPDEFGDSPDVCPGCQHECLAENVPEAFSYSEEHDRRESTHPRQEGAA